MSESKIAEKIRWRPNASTIESTPTVLQMFNRHPDAMAGPHWHAQVEVNFVMRGSVHYKMSGYDLLLSQGDLALFWGGLPHQMDWRSDDALYAGAHLPLVYFFRLRMPSDIHRNLVGGATLVTHVTGAADYENFPRWSNYVGSRDAMRSEHAVNELLLRLERIRFDPYRMIAHGTDTRQDMTVPDGKSAQLVETMCGYIAESFREEIQVRDIAARVQLHPKYAMSVFRRATGMTLNAYINLLRLSYAQAMLMEGEANVLHVALESGFGSVSAFSKFFRRLSGRSPSDFRRERAPDIVRGSF